MAVQKNYETKPVAPKIETAVMKPEPMSAAPMKCPLAACGSTNVVKDEYEKFTIIHCLKCGFIARYVDGRLV